MLASLAVLFAVLVVMSWVLAPKEEAFFDAIPYDVLEIDGLLSPEECDALIEHARPNLARSTVSTPTGNEVSNVRTSSQVWVDKNDPKVGPIVQKIMRTMARYTGTFDDASFEQVQIAKYGPGQEYRPHYDACVSERHCRGDPKIYRRATLIAYLNDVPNGGQTAFPRVSREVRPQKGRGVLFYNVEDHDRLKEIEDSLHGGLPVGEGNEKWIANLWLNYKMPESGKKKRRSIKLFFKRRR
jgi:prolyl 4-hydroxylase